MCWGRNDYGQLGINSVENRDRPRRVGLVSGVFACASPSMAVFQAWLCFKSWHMTLNAKRF
jgi:hypothetical protein